MNNPILTAQKAASNHQPIDRVTLFMAIRDAVPQKEHDKLSELRQRQDALYWQLGDMANRWYGFVVANEVPGTKDDVCAVIAHDYDDDHHGAAAIAKDAEIAAFYTDPAERKKYQILPVSHLRYAMGWGKKYKKVLEYDLRRLDENGGKHISKLRLQSHFETHPEIIQPIGPIEEPRPGLDTYEVTAPAASAISMTFGVKSDPIAEVRDDLTRLENNLPRLQRLDEKLAAEVARIILLTKSALAKIPEGAKI